MITASELDQLTIPPLRWVVPGLVPEGSGLCAAAPKEGKSWLMLKLALAAASAGDFLGVQLAQRPVLYLALEDGYRRLQERMRRILGDEPAPEDLVLEIAPENALEVARQFVLEHQDRVPLVIVDTIARVREAKDPRQSAYAADYEFAAKLKAIADLGATVLGVHHTRKQMAEDFLEAASGTNGLTGAVDFVMVLQRERNQKSATLSLTGRDVVEARYALAFDEGIWTADGAGLTEAAEKALHRHLGDTKRAALMFVNGRVETRAADLVAALGLSDSSARQTLSRLAAEGLVAKVGRGVYAPVTMSQQGEKTSSEQETNVTPPLSQRVTTSQPPVTNAEDYRPTVSSGEYQHSVGQPERDNVTGRDSLHVTNKMVIDQRINSACDDVTAIPPHGPAEGDKCPECKTPHGAGATECGWCHKSLIKAHA